MSMPRVHAFEFDRLPRLTTQEVALGNAILSELQSLDVTPFATALSSVTRHYLGEPLTLLPIGFDTATTSMSAASVPAASMPAIERVMVQFWIPALRVRVIASFSLLWAKEVIDRLLGGNGDLPTQLSSLSPMEQGVFEFFMLKFLQALRQSGRSEDQAICVWEYEGFSVSPLPDTRFDLELHGKHPSTVSLFFNADSLLRSLQTRAPHAINESWESRVLACAPFETECRIELGTLSLTLDDQRSLAAGDILLFDTSATLAHGEVSGRVKLCPDLLPDWAFTATLTPSNREPVYQLTLEHFGGLSWKSTMSEQ